MSKVKESVNGALDDLVTLKLLGDKFQGSRKQYAAVFLFPELLYGAPPTVMAEV